MRSVVVLADSTQCSGGKLSAGYRVFFVFFIIIRVRVVLPSKSQGCFTLQESGLFYPPRVRVVLPSKSQGCFTLQESGLFHPLQSRGLFFALHRRPLKRVVSSSRGVVLPVVLPSLDGARSQLEKSTLYRGIQNTLGESLAIYDSLLLWRVLYHEKVNPPVGTHIFDTLQRANLKHTPEGLYLFQKPRSGSLQAKPP